MHTTSITSSIEDFGSQQLQTNTCTPEGHGVCCFTCSCVDPSSCIHTCLIGCMPTACEGCQTNAHANLKSKVESISAAIIGEYKDFADPEELIISQQELQQLAHCEDVDVLRAFILHAIYFDTDIVMAHASHCASSRHLIHVMRAQILPLIFSTYLDHMCQLPHHFVRLAIVMQQMWNHDDLCALRPEIETEENPLQPE